MKLKKNTKIILGIALIGVGIYVIINWNAIRLKIGLLGEKFITPANATVVSKEDTIGGAEYGEF